MSLPSPHLMNTSERYDQYILPTYGRFPVEFVRGEGSRLWDKDGNEFLDFCTGIAVCSIGHSHPRLTVALTEAAQNLQHVSNLYHIPAQAELAELIVEKFVRLPGRLFFANSGAEANDGLIKSARKYGHLKPMEDGSPRYEVLTFNQSFHGRTLGSMAATGQDKIKAGFDPMLPGFRHLPFNDLAAVEAAIAPETVAIMLEPIQGEGGIRVAEDQFLHGLADLCKKHDLLLFFDEVQCGFGRTGNRCAWRSIAPEVVPDGLSWAKGMGGGVPIGSFWLSDRVIDADGTRFSDLLGPGTHGSTYGGNPLCSAASLAVLSEIHDKELWTAAFKKGQLVHELLAENHPKAIKELRGLGLMLGFEIDAEQIKVPEGQTPALTVVKALMANGLLTVPAGPDTVRWLPPLNVTDEEIQKAFTILTATLNELAKA